jgi:hypothetical protein
MRRLAVAAALLLAACASGTNERLDKMQVQIQGQILKTNRLEEDSQNLSKRHEDALEKFRKDLKELRDEIDLLRSQLATIRKAAAAATGGSDVEAEKATQEEIEYIRRTPKREETLANATKRLRPLSAAAAPFLVMEVRQAIKRADPDVVTALEKVLAGLEPDVVVRAMVPELGIKQTRIIAAEILGTVGHTSAREPLAKHLADEDFNFRFAVARALALLKGPEGKKALPVLIEALKPTHREQNILAYDLLKTTTGFTFGYKMFGPDEEKMASAAKWQEWWETHGDTFEFPEK